MCNRDWDELDEQAMGEGQAIGRSFKRTTARRGVSKVPLSTLGQDYRVKDKDRDWLAERNVIDGKATT